MVLRDLKSPDAIKILEQNYESDPLSEGLLLNQLEGKTIEFEVAGPNSEKHNVKAKLLRSGYVPHLQAFARYGAQYAQQQRAMAYDPYQGGSSLTITHIF